MKIDPISFLLGVLGRRVVIDTLARFGVTDFSIQAGLKSLKAIHGWLKKKAAYAFFVFLVYGLKKGWIQDERIKATVILTLLLFIFIEIALHHSKVQKQKKPSP